MEYSGRRVIPSSTTSSQSKFVCIPDSAFADLDSTPSDSTVSEESATYSSRCNASSSDTGYRSLVNDSLEEEQDYDNIENCQSDWLHIEGLDKPCPAFPVGDLNLEVTTAAPSKPPYPSPPKYKDLYSSKGRPVSHYSNNCNNTSDLEHKVKIPPQIVVQPCHQPGINIPIDNYYSKQPHQEKSQQEPTQECSNCKTVQLPHLDANDSDKKELITPAVNNCTIVQNHQPEQNPAVWQQQQPTTPSIFPGIQGNHFNNSSMMQNMNDSMAAMEANMLRMQRHMQEQFSQMGISSMPSFPDSTLPGSLPGNMNSVGSNMNNVGSYPDFPKLQNFTYGTLPRRAQNEQLSQQPAHSQEYGTLPRRIHNEQSSQQPVEYGTLPRQQQLSQKPAHSQEYGTLPRRDQPSQQPVQSYGTMPRRKPSGTAKLIVNNNLPISPAPVRRAKSNGSSVYVPGPAHVPPSPQGTRGHGSPTPNGNRTHHAPQANAKVHHGSPSTMVVPASKNNQVSAGHQGSGRLTPVHPGSLNGEPVGGGIMQDEDGKKQLKLQFDMHNFKPDEIKVKKDKHRLEVHAHNEVRTPDRISCRVFHQQYDLPKDVRLTKVNSKVSPDGLLTVESPVKTRHRVKFAPEDERNRLKYERNGYSTQ